MFVPTLILALVAAAAPQETTAAPSAAPVAPAASAATAPASGDLVIKDSYWGRVVGKILIDSYGPVSVDVWGPPRIDPRRRSAAPPGVLLRRETYALVRNTGSHKIKSVSWEFVFYSDRERTHDIARASFVTKEDIAPGELKYLTQNVEDVAPSAFSSVSIVRVEYADGTPAWQRPGAVAPQQQVNSPKLTVTGSAPSAR